MIHGNVWTDKLWGRTRMFKMPTWLIGTKENIKNGTVQEGCRVQEVTNIFSAHIA